MTHARNQDGFALIEVIVSAAVLAIVALAVLAGIDGATASTARERARAVAASLAEQDQERLRSFRYDELTQLVGLDPADPRVRRPLTVGGVQYAVQSEVTLRVDSGAPTTGCGTAGAKQGEYLRIVTTVTSTIVGKRVAPQRIESLVAPPVSGSLVVKVLNAKAAGVSGAAVVAKAKSGRTYSGTTDAQGCVPLVGVESGGYTITAEKANHVDKTGNTPARTEATVTPNLVNVVTLSLDVATDLSVNVRTLPPGTVFSTSATSYPSRAANVSDNSAETNTLRTYTPATPSSTIEVPRVFPFVQGYSFFTGKCVIQSPARNGLTNYFSQTNPAAVVLADPAKSAAERTATVYQPSLNLRINSTSDLSSNTSYRVYPHLLKLGEDGCDEFQGTPELDIKTWPSSGFGSQPSGSTKYNWIVQAGSGFDPGLPFGKYKICVRNTSTNRWSSFEYDNTKTHEPTTKTIAVPSQTQSGAGC
jgi:prepilin-type N-terminal cleavage/methylation domain-containing protein